jgi:choline dehydrogenase-like flavoprotein
MCSAMDATDESALFAAPSPEWLRSLVAQVIPAGAGAGPGPAELTEFVTGVLTSDRPDWVSRVSRLAAEVSAADGLRQHRDGEWFADLVWSGYYASPRSWPAVGWLAEPAGGWGEPVADAPIPTVAPWDLAGSYDAVVVGAGAGGGAAAEVLAASGRRVLIVELGGQPDHDALSDPLRNPRATLGLPGPTDPAAAVRPRVSELAGDVRVVLPPDGRYGNNAFTVGGGTRVYGAQAWRFGPDDFRMATRYGVPDGSDLADWPIGYSDLESFYELAERRFGVSGDVSADPWVPRSGPLPMPPITRTRSGDLLADAAVRLGWGVVAPPLLINSVDRDGRRACVKCPSCVGFGCPVEAKAGTHNTALPAAVARGAALCTGTTVERLVVENGRVTGVALVAERDGRIWRGTVRAGEVVLGAGATETARLLLLSDVGTDHDQVGRRLQGHVYAGALGVFADPVADLIGPGVSLGTCDFRHGNDGFIGGGILANEFVPTPQMNYAYLTRAGLLDRFADDLPARMAQLTPRMLRVAGPIQEVTNAESRVRLDPEVTDRYGNPVARLSGSTHDEDRRIQRRQSARAAEWLAEAGAVRVIRTGEVSPGAPSVGQHQAGTCRMGTEPGRSVTDPWGRVWGHDNVRIVDGSVHVTNGGVNPVLTILAGALRIATHMSLA